MGTSCFPHFTHSPFSNSSSSLCSSQFTPLLSCSRNAQRCKKKRPVLLCMQSENQKEGDLCRRRTILFVGFSVLPLLNLRAKAFEEWPVDSQGQPQKEETEQTIQGSAGNPFLSLLNGLGVVGSGVLGSLYALGRNEKAVSDATIESMKNKLKDKEDALVSMEKKFESELLNEREIRKNQLKRAGEEQQAVLNELNSAKDALSILGKELQNEKRSAEELKFKIKGLQNDLMRMKEDKKKLQEELKGKLDLIQLLQEKITLLTTEIKDKEASLQSSTSKLAEKELEVDRLSSMYQQSQDQLRNLTSEIKELKDEVQKRERELELKRVSEDSLNVQINSLFLERDESRKELHAIQKEYNEFKSNTEEKVASDAELLGEQEKRLHQLEEQLGTALGEASKNKVLIADLTREKENLRRIVDAELDNVNKLKQEIEVTRESVEKSRREASDITVQLEQSRHLCSKLEAEVSKLQMELEETRTSLQRNIDETKHDAELLAAELTTTKELLKKTKEEMHTTSNDLAAVSENRDSLQTELVDVYKKAERAAKELKDEKNLVDTLDKELKFLETQITKEKELRNNLEEELEKATESLDDMNKNVVALAKELEFANSHISSLDDEREVLQKSVSEQKQISQEARENLEDAHSLVMKLGKERESLEKRSKKLEDEMAAAKGEILRLRSQINSAKAPVNNEEKVEDGEQAKATVPVKRTRRRKTAVKPEGS
ncbi:MAR-binding filament-like protein 1-1 [Capsicum annuum]|uniref:MAR-binding filament-like protein 1-1 n=1 Tax=Capsicum annuum TaxID=4072 RepID=A0A2G3A3G2_CAPAN|nr:MAR-binding filament-like protein 1 [Capsicum annuum]KAF3633103.1 MAR-binding filament-like protein 1-1 [Capsicum annuum]PHT88772.1 MAR-binding filament-like protein 1-1 [Capsicum annuum]